MMRTTFYLSLFSLNSWSIVYAMCLIESFGPLNFHSDLLLILFMHIPMTKLPSSSPWKNPAYSLIFFNIQLLRHFLNEVSPFHHIELSS